MSSFLPQKVQQHNQKDCHLLAEIKVHNETDPPKSVHNITDNSRYRSVFLLQEVQ